MTLTLNSITKKNEKFEQLSEEQQQENTLEIREVYSVNIYKSINNTIITISDSQGTTIQTLSCGRLGYKKGKRKHYNAYQALWYSVINLLKKKQISVVTLSCYYTVHYAYRSVLPVFFKKHNIKVLKITVHLTKPFNGCKLRKSR